MRERMVAFLEELAQVHELAGENVFKVRAFRRAAETLAALSDVDAAELPRRLKDGSLTEIPGIGQGIRDALTEWAREGRSQLLEDLEARLPTGLRELTELPGLGPKKARAIIEELGIHSIGELEYACRENRLLKLKGFGAKLQAQVLAGIEFRRTTQGRLRLVDALPWAESISAELARLGLRSAPVGELGRRMEVVESLEFLITPQTRGGAITSAALAQAALSEWLEGEARQGRKLALPVALEWVGEAERFWGAAEVRRTATEAHLSALVFAGGTAVRAQLPESATAMECYARLGLPLIPPECRDTAESVGLARGAHWGELLGEPESRPLRGVFHVHTTRSDGSHTLEQMVERAAELGFEYIGISDHSQSAFYAQGLKPEALREQRRERDQVQSRFPGVRIFWGIESDILADGSLDYDEAQLAEFDFVVASIHSRFQMDRDTMTERIVQALRHPRTRMLGHPTGRLLLGRQGYAVDLERIIEEAARHDVALELNCNPARLDLDWRWGAELRKRGARVAINPDAHDRAGLEDTRFGVWMARKALLTRAQVINTQPTSEVERWLRRG